MSHRATIHTRVKITSKLECLTHASLMAQKQEMMIRQIYVTIQSQDMTQIQRQLQKCRSLSIKTMVRSKMKPSLAVVKTTYSLTLN